MPKHILFILFFSFSSTLWAQVPQNGLFAYYPLDGSARDTSGHGYHGKLNNSYTLPAERDADRNGNLCALCFGNWTLEIDFPNPPPSTASLSYWVKLPDRSASFMGNIVTGSSLRDTITIRQPSGAPIASFKALANAWNHLVLTKPDAAHLAVYLNGTIVGTFAYSGTIIASAIYSNPGSYCLDDIAIYDHILTESEINALYTAKSSCIALVTDLNGESETSNPSLAVFPNPSVSGIFQLIGTEKETLLLLEDMMGKSFTASSWQENILDISNLPKGIYVATFTSKGQNRKIKLMRE